MKKKIDQILFVVLDRYTNEYSTFWCKNSCWEPEMGSAERISKTAQTIFFKFEIGASFRFLSKYICYLLQEISKKSFLSKDNFRSQKEKYKK